MVTLLRWFFGIGFIVTSLGFLSHGFSFAILPGLFLAAILIPPIDKAIASKMTDEKAKAAYAKKGTKIILAILLFALFTATSPKSASTQVADTQKDSNQPASTAQAKAEPVFDMPSLISKNLDEIKQTLGEPEGKQEMTKAQKELISEWDYEYKKDGRSLLVTYNTRSNAVDNIWLEGTDKNELMTAGNIEKKSDSYVTSYTYGLGDNKDKVTGITIAKKLSSDMAADIKYNFSGIQIKNTEDLDWKSCKVTLNSDYKYNDLGTVEARGTVEVNFAKITKKDGSRFNVIATSPKSICVSCDTNSKQSRIGCYSF